MVKMNIVYEGQLHCRLTHESSGCVIATDAPKDNHGKGEAFSPTDLVSAALGSCMLTIMGIAALKHGISLEGSTAAVEKEMITVPVRRIGSVRVVLRMAKGVPVDKRGALEAAGLACPVHQSLHPDVKQDIQFIWD